MKQNSPDQANAHMELQAFMNVSPIPMVLWLGPDHIYTIVNPAHDRMLNKKVIGKSISESHTEEEAKGVSQILDRVYQTGVPYISKEKEYCLLDENGELRTIYVNEWFHPFPDREGKVIGVIGVAQDVTELRVSLSKLEQERDLRERFVSTLSHDLRTPLTAAKMCAQLLGRKADDTEAVRTLAVKIVSNIDRSDVMIRDLLDANQIQAGEKLPIEIGACQLDVIIRETIDDLGTVHGDRFLVSLPNEAIHGFWGCTGLKRIIENLCNNAVKYGAKDRKITVSLSHSESQVVLSVHNWGNAISSDDQKSLFKQYRRTESAHSGLEMGWGLGLTLVKGIAEAHSGFATVESSAEEGTTFKVTLPLDSRA